MFIFYVRVDLLYGKGRPVGEFDFFMVTDTLQAGRTVVGGNLVSLKSTKLYKNGSRSRLLFSRHDGPPCRSLDGSGPPRADKRHGAAGSHSRSRGRPS